MDKAEARQRLQEYANHERRIQRRFVAPTMLFFALFQFIYLVTGGFGTWWAHVLILGLSAAWIVYARRLTGVSFTRSQRVKLALTLFVTFYWGIACRAYFVNWNPHDLPVAYLLGAILAAAPFLVLARFYRP